MARAAAKIANPKFVLYLQGTAFPDLTVSGPTRRHFSEQCIKLARLAASGEPTRKRVILSVTGQRPAEKEIYYVRIGSLLRDRRRKSAGDGGGRWNDEKLSEVEISSAAQSTSAWYAILLN